jgi:hypothetical protein
MEVAALPRTGTGKIRRAALRELWEAAHPADMPALSEAPEAPGEAEAAEADPRAAGLTGPEARLAATWRRVTGPAALTRASSFYDAGGDSLSSVQIGLVMEREGWSRAAVRATFEGRALGEVARLEAPVPPASAPSASAPPGAEPAGADPMAPVPASAPASGALPDRTVRNWSVSMARGIMALSLLVSHWGPGLFGALGVGALAEQWLSTVYRAGTPGFAAVFGIGIGYFMLPGFAENRASVLRRLSMSFRLVAVAVILLALVTLLERYMQGREIDLRRLSSSVYNVLLYYAIMLGTAPLWLPALARLRDPRVLLVASVPLLWLAWQGMGALLPAEQLGLLESARLMAGRGGYNVFKMTMVAAAGAALGYWIAQQADTRAMADRLLLLGGSAMALCLFAMGQMEGFDALGRRGNLAFTSVPGLMFYVAAAATLTGAGLRLVLGWAGLGRALRLPLKLLVVTGGLALPIYVLHGLVLPLRNVLAAAGLPGVVALALPMGAFLASMGYAGRRLWRMYFG